MGFRYRLPISRRVSERQSWELDVINLKNKINQVKSPHTKKLGEILMEEGLIDEEEYNEELNEIIETLNEAMEEMTIE